MPANALALVTVVGNTVNKLALVPETANDKLLVNSTPFTVNCAVTVSFLPAAPTTNDDPLVGAIKAGTEAAQEQPDKSVVVA